MPTKIEWTNETWNPVTGCTKISEGCKNCYAERMARRLASRYGYQEYPYHFDVTLHPDKLNQPLKWKKPRRIFVCSMGDLFHIEVPIEYVLKVFNIMQLCPHHTFQVLTKRPRIMKDTIEEIQGKNADYFYNTHPNVWLGATAENQKTADERIPILLKIPATIRFVSVEPMLNKIELNRETMVYCPRCSHVYFDSFQWSSCPNCNAPPLSQRDGRTFLSYLDWVICGGETGYGAREMKAEWAWNLYNQCREADVPFFFKKPGDAFQGGELPNIREYPKG